MKMTYVRLLVDKFDECFSFYADTLGFAPTWGKPGETYASFRASETTSLSLFKRELMLAALQLPAPPPSDKLYGFVLILESGDVDAAYNALTAKGVKTLDVPHDMPGWGSRCFHLTDPEGNLVEIHKELPKATWDEDLKNHPDAKNHA